MTDKECRPGVITAIHRDEITVCIRQVSACAGCHARGVCSSSDSADRYLTIQSQGHGYAVGDHVIIEGERHVGRLAVSLAFVIPIIILIAGVAIGTLLLEWSEGLSALATLGVLALYYLGLRLIDPQLGRIMQFRLTKVEE